ncbi:L,D-transpeptidase [Peterkaempfera sp. SMS 1(5)a]|uniref:L,D-transpeptidase n=1 Tax=Peterkaempfera podocarpi TaxID=3232308 RepID=UPI00366DA670
MRSQQCSRRLSGVRGRLLGMSVLAGLLITAAPAMSPAHAVTASNRLPALKGASPESAHAWSTVGSKAKTVRGCPVRTYRVVCVDLNHQVLWVQTGRRIVFDDVPVRTGRVGNATRTGWFRVYRRDIDHWSKEYKSPMPYSQFFSGGQALHGVYGGVDDGPGSHGCVNLVYDDAQALWRVIGKGTAVYTWGHKPKPQPESESESEDY